MLAFSHIMGWCLSVSRGLCHIFQFFLHPRQVERIFCRGAMMKQTFDSFWKKLNYSGRVNCDPFILRHQTLLFQRKQAKYWLLSLSAMISWWLGRDVPKLTGTLSLSIVSHFEYQPKNTLCSGTCSFKTCWDYAMMCPEAWDVEVPEIRQVSLRQALRVQCQVI